VANTTDYLSNPVQETPHHLDRYRHRDGNENYLLRVQIERFKNGETEKVSITNQTSINNSSDGDHDDVQLSTTTTTTGKGPQNHHHTNNQICQKMLMLQHNRHHVISQQQQTLCLDLLNQ
jgi:hypothetical protein